MIYFKDSQSKVIICEDNIADKYIRNDWVEIDKAEADLLMAPTTEQAAELARLQAKADRDAALQSMTHTFPDGRTIQTRPQDQQWIQGGIDIGGDEWILADNTKANVTAAELQEALDAGKLQAKQIMDTYKAQL